MGLPPSEDGAVQETVARASPAVAETAVGAAGAVTTTCLIDQMWPRPGVRPRVASSAAYTTPAGSTARPLTLAKPEAYALGLPAEMAARASKRATLVASPINRAVPLVSATTDRGAAMPRPSGLATQRLAQAAGLMI